MDFTGFVDVSMVVMFIGIMAFIVSVITEGLKKITWLESRVPTAITVIILSLVLCPLCMVAAMCWMKQPIAWYMVFASFIAAFIVALVAMEGWGLLQNWQAVQFPKQKQESRLLWTM